MFICNSYTSIMIAANFKWDANFYFIYLYNKIKKRSISVPTHCNGRQLSCKLRIEKFTT